MFSSRRIYSLDPPNHIWHEPHMAMGFIRPCRDKSTGDLQFYLEEFGPWCRHPTSNFRLPQFFNLGGLRHAVGNWPTCFVG